MITFILSLVILIAGYFFYGKLTEKIFGIDTKRQTAAVTKQDGVDYIPMKPWRIFLIQFFFFSVVGPIFGAIMGAKFGTVSFLWIVFGSILGGAVHDYLSGMISLRQDGASLPEIHGKYLGKGMKQFMRAFMVILMVLVGAVFVSAPATLLAGLTSWNVLTWIVVIIIYYVIATLLPIDKIIGKIYPIFGICMLFMVVGILFSIFYYQPELPEVWDGIQNRHPDAATTPIFPMMFISIACGAISGFHATQSPLMARCIKNEKNGRFVFYGAMVSEGIVALVWAAAATAYFQDHGTSDGTGQIVMNISKSWLGTAGGILAVLGVIAAPITSGDTALRSARLIIADMLHIEQKKIRNRLYICIPLFALTLGVLIFSIVNKDGFGIIWRYFAWCNQTLAVFTLWAITVFLCQARKTYSVTLIPAMFMTMVTATYLCVAPEGLHFSPLIAYLASGLFTLAMLEIGRASCRER